MQSGTVNFNKSFDKKIVDVASVTFPKTFSKTPKVYIQLTDSDIGDEISYQEQYLCVPNNFIATNISTTGFTIQSTCYYAGRSSMTFEGILDWCAYEE